jgi:hypothetical protein
MDPTPTTDVADKRRLLVLAGLAAIPVYVLPVGMWGVRALWPRVLRDVATGAIALGVLSLVGLSLRSVPRLKPDLSSVQRWKLPFFGPLMPEEFAASAASGR